MLLGHRCRLWLYDRVSGLVPAEIYRVKPEKKTLLIPPALAPLPTQQVLTGSFKADMTDRKDKP